MIQIRKKDGSVVAVEEGCFVELVNDLDRSVGSVFFQADMGVCQICPGTRDAARYARMFGGAVKFTETYVERDLTTA